MTKNQQKILMCAPDYFGVDYVINPWMVEGFGKTNHALACQQWESLKDLLAQQTEITLVSPQKGWPDMVFTANAGLVLEKTVIVTRFSSTERQGEEPFFRRWFEQNGFMLADWPSMVPFEGAGDALFDRGESLLWAAHGFRSHLGAAPLLERVFRRRVVSLHLVDPRFYHLDTCLCPLPGGYVMYFPEAFDEASQKQILDIVPPQKRIVVSQEDALAYACNAVDLHQSLFMNGASEALQHRLRDAGFRPVIVPLSEFMKSGGAAKCLTLKLHEI